MKEKEFIEIVQGKKRSLVATLVRGLLFCFQPAYWIGWRLDQWKQNKRQTRVDIPVVSIGNITTGGTGKSPMVHYLCRWFIKRNLNPVVLSRGYGGSANESRHNDEWLELNHRLPNVTHLQDRDRVAIARKAIKENAPDVLILDDGFQHRRLARDIDIVLIDATNPYGYGYLLPRGLLREPRRQLEKANTIIITRCEQVGAKDVEAIETELRKFNQSCSILRSTFESSCFVDRESQALPLDSQKGKSVFAFAGIGNPDNFFETLRQMELNLVATKSFADHHNYSAGDFSEELLPKEATNADIWVCTMKDLVKLKSIESLEREIHALVIDMNIEGELEFPEEMF